MKKERVKKERDHLSLEKENTEERERENKSELKKKYNSATVPSYIVGLVKSKYCKKICNTATV